MTVFVMWLNYISTKDYGLFLSAYKLSKQ